MKHAYVLALCGILAGCTGGDPGGAGGKGGTGGKGGSGGAAGGGGSGGGASGGVGGMGGTGGSGGTPSESPDLAVVTPDMAMPADMATGGTGGTGGSGGSNAPYPSGPYGVGKGEVIDAAFSWDCIKPGESDYSKVTSKDFFDPDGSRKINALLLDASYLGCQYCEQEAQSEEAEWDKSWKDNGAVAVTLLSSGSDPKGWVDMFKLKHIYVCKDPNNSLQAQGYPSNVVVDPRSMKVYDVIQGYSDGALSPVTDLATKNKK